MSGRITVINSLASAVLWYISSIIKLDLKFYQVKMYFNEKYSPLKYLEFLAYKAGTSALYLP